MSESEIRIEDRLAEVEKRLAALYAEDKYLQGYCWDRQVEALCAERDELTAKIRNNLLWGESQ